jgi:hypothetical protein
LASSLIFQTLHARRGQSRLTASATVCGQAEVLIDCPEHVHAAIEVAAASVAQALIEDRPGCERHRNDQAMLVIPSWNRVDASPSGSRLPNGQWRRWQKPRASKAGLASLRPSHGNTRTRPYRPPPRESPAAIVGRRRQPPQSRRHIRRFAYFCERFAFEGRIRGRLLSAVCL